MKTIIVPTDFSNASVNAALYAVDMALTIDAKILLVHVVSLPVTISEVPIPPDSFDSLINDAKQELDILKEKLTKRAENKVAVFTLAQVGNISETVEEIAKQANPFAIILGSQGHTSAEHLLLGSTITALLRNSHYPLIVVPNGVQFKKIDKLGLACDMKDVNKTIPLRGIEMFAAAFNCSIDIMYVSKNGDKMDTATLNESLLLQNHLKKYAPQLHYVVSEEIEAGINNYAKTNGIDLVLVVAKNRDFPTSIMHKSISKSMVRHEHVPLLILKEPTEEEINTSPDKLINLFAL